jgi:hypothetical protein
MNSKHYDIAIIGGSLAAGITAALLAKQGSKVLFLRNREVQAPAWFHSSIFLEKILGVLGGRSCFVAQRPVQVLSEKTRLTICGDIPIEDELAREFGTSGPAVSQWLSELHILGVRLEELFWENGGLPWPSFKAAARFKLLCMRRRINLSELEQPVTKKLEQIPSAARLFITDLLQGLSLFKMTELSYARAAMLWAQVLRPENLKEPDFSLMLSKRFEQFHGAKAQLDDLQALAFDGSRWSGGDFKSGGRFTAKTFLLGDKRWIDLFSAGKTTLTHLPQSPVARRTSDLSGQLSSLLATRILCGGELPLRLAIEEHDHELHGLVLSSPEATEVEIRRQLEPVLPFAKYKLTEMNSSGTDVTQPTRDVTQPIRETQSTQLANLPVQIGTNLYCADGAALFPEMGATGAALLAWTLVDNLGN